MIKGIMNKNGRIERSIVTLIYSLASIERLFLLAHHLMTIGTAKLVSIAVFAFIVSNYVLEIIEKVRL